MMQVMEPPEQAPEQRVDVYCPPEKRAGVWANFAQVSHSPYEFTLDFARLEFDGAKPMGGIVVERVSMSPLFILQLIEALQENYTRWAEKALPPEVQE
jgi:hypothetical protein